MITLQELPLSSTMSFDNPAFENSPSTSQRSLPESKVAEDILEMEDISKIIKQESVDVKHFIGEPTAIAVSVRNAHKSYQSGTPVLVDFNMSVPTGAIYSLLGSSGCGKTTLLACCVGVRNLDRGEILVYGHKPGTKESGVPGRRVGYMPQELSLYDELTIQEALNFYGRIYGMRREEVAESTNFLLDFLDLPSATRRVGSLSGGQKRRVSIALALIHGPELLILDEPTVGVDPLLRESIWNHLVKLVSTGRTTIIITTHYIQEASQSNVIGIMRNGRLLAEKSPDELIKEFQVTNLEDIVLTLCRADREEKSKSRKGLEENAKDAEWKMNYFKKLKIGQTQGDSTVVEQGNVVGLSYGESEKSNNKDIIDNVFTQSPQSKHSLQSVRSASAQSNGHLMSDVTTLNMKNLSTRDSTSANKSTALERVKALLIKNFIILIRNIGFLIFIFFVPAIQVILICLTIGADPKYLRFGVINAESCDFESSNWRDIGKTCPVDGSLSGPENSNLSCFYLSLLPTESFILEREPSQQNALRRIQKGHTYGYVQFPKGYTQNVLCRFNIELDCPAPEVVRTGSSIIFELDMSNKQVGQTMKRIFAETYSKALEKINENCKSTIPEDYLQRISNPPYTFKKPVYGRDDTSFREFLAPSILLGLLFFFPLCSSGVSYITEKKSGTLDRTLVAGVDTTELMGGFLISQVCILIGQAGFAFLILTQVFHIEIVGSISLALFLTILIGISGMSAGFLMSMMCTEEVQAVLLAIGTFFPNILLAGMVWPLEGMDRHLQYVSYLLPCTLACESMRSIISRGWGLFHRSVWPGFLSTLAWIAAYWVLAVVIRKFRNKG